MAYDKHKETKEDVTTALKVVQEVKDQLGPLATALRPNAPKSEKEGQKL